MSLNGASATGPRVLFVYFTYTRQSLKADGTVAVKETGDHLGRKGLEIGGGVGLVVGCSRRRCSQRPSSAARSVA